MRPGQRHGAPGLPQPRIRQSVAIRPPAGIVGGPNDRNVVVLAQRIHQAVTAAGAMTKKLLRMRTPGKP
jgi:hypothetical protein